MKELLSVLLQVIFIGEHLDDPLDEVVVPHFKVLRLPRHAYACPQIGDVVDHFLFT